MGEAPAEVETLGELELKSEAESLGAETLGAETRTEVVVAVGLPGAVAGCESL